MTLFSDTFIIWTFEFEINVFPFFLVQKGYSRQCWSFSLKVTIHPGLHSYRRYVLQLTFLLFQSWIKLADCLLRSGQHIILPCEDRNWEENGGKTNCLFIKFVTTFMHFLALQFNTTLTLDLYHIAMCMLQTASINYGQICCILRVHILHIVLSNDRSLLS